MPLTGDFAKLGRLRATLERLGRIPSRVAARAAPLIDARLREQFATGTDPYGKGWAPLAASTVRRKGFDTILVESGAGRAGTSAATASGAGIRIVLGPHLAFHMLPAKGRPERKVLPTQGLPRGWRADIAAVYLEEMGREFRG